MSSPGTINLAAAGHEMRSRTSRKAVTSAGVGRDDQDPIDHIGARLPRARANLDEGPRDHRPLAGSAVHDASASSIRTRRATLMSPEQEACHGARLWMFGFGGSAGDAAPRKE